MIYFDSDGVLADFTNWVRKFDPSVKNSDYDKIHKIMVDHYKECFLTSKVLPHTAFYFEVLKKDPDTRVLTALSPAEKLAPFCTDISVETVLAYHKENKYRWFENQGVPRDKVIIVNCGKDKVRFCNGISDVLYDDYAKNIEMLKQKGGTGVLVRRWNNC